MKKYLPFVVFTFLCVLMFLFRFLFNDNGLPGQLPHLFIIPTIATLIVGLSPQLLTIKNIIYLTIGIILGILLIRNDPGQIIVYKILFTLVGSFLSWLYLFLREKKLNK